MKHVALTKKQRLVFERFCDGLRPVQIGILYQLLYPLLITYGTPQGDYNINTIAMPCILRIVMDVPEEDLEVVVNDKQLVEWLVSAYYELADMDGEEALILMKLRNHMLLDISIANGDDMDNTIMQYISLEYMENIKNEKV